MEKLFTDTEYADKAVEANSTGQALYVYVHDLEYEIDVPEYTYEDKEVEQQVFDEEGNPVLDEEGNPTYETVIVKVPVPIMETVTEPNPRAGEIHTEIDPETGEEIEVVEPETITYERQKTHKETKVKEVGELLLAPANFYICYEENYTHKEENPNYYSDIEKAEQERIAKLSLTRGDVFRGVLRATGITKDQIRAMIDQMPETTPEEKEMKELAKIDFEDSLDFFRGVPIVDILGNALGFTKEQLDKFFETNDYHVLMPPEPEPEVPVEPEVTPDPVEPEAPVEPAPEEVPPANKEEPEVAPDPVPEVTPNSEEPKPEEVPPAKEELAPEEVPPAKEEPAPEPVEKVSKKKSSTKKV